MIHIVCSLLSVYRQNKPLYRICGNKNTFTLLTTISTIHINMRLNKYLFILENKTSVLSLTLRCTCKFCSVCVFQLSCF